VADRGYVLERGQVVAAGLPVELRKRYAAGIDPSRPAW
jgi:ABC-type branched-subunit amino acid transport system ATPase component